LGENHEWSQESRLVVETLDEMQDSDMFELIRGEFERVNPGGKSPSESLTQAIFERYGSRPLSVKALFSLDRIQRLLRSGDLSEVDIERCPTDLESLLREYFDQTPKSVQKLMSLASLAGFEFNRSPVLKAGDELSIPDAGLSLAQSDEPYGLIEVASSDVAEFVDPILHQIAERKSHDFFGTAERQVIVDQLVRFAQSLDADVDTEETCRIGWSIHVSLAEKGLANQNEAVKSAQNLRNLYSKRYCHELSRRYAQLVVEWTPNSERTGETFRESQAELANLEYVMGAEARAEKLYAELLENNDNSANPDREKSLFFRHMRGVCLKKLGQLEEAIQLLEQVRLERIEFSRSFSAETNEAIDSDHREHLQQVKKVLRDAYNSQHHVSICRRLMGQPAEAETENNRLLAEQTHWLGPEHEDCIATEIEIGRCMFDRGEFLSAEAWFANLYLRAERILGNHPYRWIILGERSRALAQTQGASSSNFSV